MVLPEKTFVRLAGQNELQISIGVAALRWIGKKWPSHRRTQ